MTKLVYVRPAREGAIIRDPVSKLVLPPEGEAKPHDLHWARRLTRREVVETAAAEVEQGRKAREAKEAAEKAAAEAGQAEPIQTAEPAPKATTTTSKA